MTIFMDALNRPIDTGDTLVHAYAINSSAGLRRCVVIGFTPKMMRVQPVEFKTEYKRTQDSVTGKPKVERVTKHPLEPVKPSIIQAGHTVLKVNGDDWPELEKMRMMGFLV